MTSKNLESKLEEDTPVSGTEVSPTRIKISKRALKSIKKDNRIKNDFIKYQTYIGRIAQNPLEYPTEKIGEFNISPRGSNPLRIAWHYNKEENIVYIDELLYHINNKSYNGNWNSKASKGELMIEDYVF